jgi:Ni/Co efflux regulator RcnB
MLRILAAVLALLLAAAPALADQGKGKGKGNSGKPNGGTMEDVVEGVTAGVLGAVLSDDERRIIHRYFGEHPDTVKVKELPPGIRKKLARGGAMPPGIAMQVLPDGLHRQLPPRFGQHYEIIGTDVVLVETATRVIVDVLKDVLRGN